jgi:inositol-phosphate transport system substrate-binding protein
MIYKPALVELGWTEEQITAWVNDMRAGKLTLDDFQDVAKQVVDAGICEYGLTHRPNKGADWRYFFISFAGGEVPINEEGQITVSTKHVANYLSFFRENVQLGITPYNSLTDFNWDMLEGDIWPNGKTFGLMANISVKGDCMKASGVTSEYWDENFLSIPIPVSEVGETPACGANPHAWMLTTSSQSSEKMSEYCRRLLDCVLAPEYQVVLSVESGHVAITKSVLEHPTYAADRWLSDIEWATPYLFTTNSTNPSLGLYGHSQELYDALQEAELDALVDGARSIEEIAEECVAKMTFNMDDGTYVVID